MERHAESIKINCVAICFQEDSFNQRFQMPQVFLFEKKKHSFCCFHEVNIGGVWSVLTASIITVQRLRGPKVGAAGCDGRLWQVGVAGDGVWEVGSGAALTLAQSLKPALPQGSERGQKMTNFLHTGWFKKVSHIWFTYISQTFHLTRTAIAPS